jgi:hypothetical protein
MCGANEEKPPGLEVQSVIIDENENAETRFADVRSQNSKPR